MEMADILGAAPCEAVSGGALLSVEFQQKKRVQDRWGLHKTVKITITSFQIKI